MSTRLDRLIQRYEQFCALPWENALAGAQRVWFVVYDKTDERRMRVRVGEFELATKKLGHGWRHIDLTNAFGDWMASQEYRDSLFEDPEDLDLLLPEFEKTVVAQITTELEHSAADANSMVAISGIACLYGFTKVSSVIQTVAPTIRGRLSVFFPGEYEDNNYRLLDARDGWNYMAIPITAHDGANA